MTLMSDGDDFELWLGKIGARDRSVGQSLARARRMGGQASARSRRFTGAAIGRGAGVGRVLRSGDRHAGLRSRRVVVKARIVRLGKGMAAAAHLRYLQRDGTTRDGERGTLYGPDADQVDGKAFLERGAGDRHQFRFIVAPEDGAEYEDLKPLVRRLMLQVEQDLGTKLDWVAVDHFNTGHPHSHVMLRGADARGQDIVIAREYLTQGLRARAAELVNLDLGPRTDREIMAAQNREIDQERFTDIDRRLLREAGTDRQLSLTGLDAQDHSLRIGRLRTLERLGLAEQARDGRWTLDPELEPILRRLSERGDIIRTLNREMREAGIYRPPQHQALFSPQDGQAEPIAGRVVAVGLSDEHRDRRYMVIDGFDGTSHYADIGEDDGRYPVGSIVRLSARPVSIRKVDHAIADIAAAHEGRYSVDIHLRHDPLATEDRAQAHVRRLEAMRRAIGQPIREPDGTWRIGTDHRPTAETYERHRNGRFPVEIETLSTKPLEQLLAHDGETWLDRELTSENPEALGSGFGADVRTAMVQRRQWLVDQQLAQEQDDSLRFRATMLMQLRQRDFDRTVARTEEETGLRHSPVRNGERVEGIYRKAVEVGDRRYGLIEKSREFSLVPWRPVLERAVGKQISGIMREEGISWTIGGRSRGIGL
jgi:type IV secretory pathway VirD2 relaxase